MGSAFAVQIAVHDPDDCPVAAASVGADGPATGVARTSTGDRTVTEEFVLPADATVPDERATAVATFDARSRYRFTRDRGRSCACEVVERTVGPVSTVRARDGTLYVRAIARDREAVREVVAALRETYDDVAVNRLLPAGDAPGADPVVVDRAELTDRQREVLATAHELGFFEHPRAANTGEVAAALGVSTSTVREHLAAAQRKLLDGILDG